MEVQRLLGADIQMQFDECVRLPCSRGEAERAMRLSLRWAERSRSAFGRQAGRAIFGIVHGGTEKDLRLTSSKGLVEMGFHGYAIGGLAVGEPQAAMLEIIESVVPYLPLDKPRYLMGVGTPDDLLQSLRRGIDMFDCVLPTRAGRHGLVYTRRGRLNLRNARFAEDPRPVDPLSSSPMARDYSRAYWRHLKVGRDPRHDGPHRNQSGLFSGPHVGRPASRGGGRVDFYISEAQRDWAEGEAERD